MPWSAIRTFADPDVYFAGIRNLQIDGVITKRGEFRADSTHIDLHRLFMYRSDESLPRIMNCGKCCETNYCDRIGQTMTLPRRGKPYRPVRGPKEGAPRQNIGD
jgi:hypothetical protein